VYDVVVNKFTFAISFFDELLVVSVTVFLSVGFDEVNFYVKVLV